MNPNQQKGLRGFASIASAFADIVEAKMRSPPKDEYAEI